MPDCCVPDGSRGPFHRLHAGSTTTLAYYSAVLVATPDSALPTTALVLRSATPLIHTVLIARIASPHYSTVLMNKPGHQGATDLQLAPPPCTHANHIVCSKAT